MLMIMRLYSRYVVRSSPASWDTRPLSYYVWDQHNAMHILGVFIYRVGVRPFIHVLPQPANKLCCMEICENLQGQCSLESVSPEDMDVMRSDNHIAGLLSDDLNSPRYKFTICIVRSYLSCFNGYYWYRLNSTWNEFHQEITLRRWTCAGNTWLG